MNEVQVLTGVALTVTDTTYGAEVIDIHDDLDAMQAFVGGRIEALKSLAGGALMYVNEDGIGLGLKPNKFATVFAWCCGMVPIGEFVYGDAIVLSDAGDGEDGDCPAWAAMAIKDICLADGAVQAA
jgi:hypothetical protein